MVDAREFRDDLFFRLSTFPLKVPALRERPEDIPLLAREILSRMSLPRDGGRVGLSADAEEAMRAYSWPGNIRELNNVLERAALATPPSVTCSRTRPLACSLGPCT